MFRDAGVAEWQTHLTQNQAGNTVWVQVPPPAPNISVMLTRVIRLILITFFVFRIFTVTMDLYVAVNENVAIIV